MGAMGTFIGAVLTIPPAVYLLSPSIKVLLQGESDVPGVWRRLGSVFEIPGDEPKLYRVEFPQRQTYDARTGEGRIVNAVLVSWRDGNVPEILGDRGAGELSDSEVEELSRRLNVLSNHCTHLGCPVRWLPDRGEILCPCHGGIYSINGEHLAGPPPRGLYRYDFEVRGDGGIYVRHEFDGTPYVV